MTKVGDRHKVMISSLKSSVKAIPLDPKIAAAIRGESIEEDEAKKKSKADNKNLATAESSRKKAENETDCNQTKKVTKKIVTV